MVAAYLEVGYILVVGYIVVVVSILAVLHLDNNFACDSQTPRLGV